MSPLLIRCPFKMKQTNDYVVKDILFDSRWTCQTFIDKMQSRVRDEFDTTNEMRFTFLLDRKGDFIDLELVPYRNTNILEFLNIGYRMENYKKMCFFISPPEESKAEESKVEESKTDDDKKALVKESNPEVDVSSLCAVCITTKKNVVFMPCRHLTCCESCAANTSIVACVLCRTPIECKITIFY